MREREGRKREGRKREGRKREGRESGERESAVVVFVSPPLSPAVLCCAVVTVARPAVGVQSVAEDTYGLMGTPLEPCTDAAPSFKGPRWPISTPRDPKVSSRRRGAPR